MIDQLTYDEILKYSQKIYKESKILQEISKNKNIQEINDFIASLDSYSKYLESTVIINQDADKALEELLKSKKD